MARFCNDRLNAALDKGEEVVDSVGVINDCSNMFKFFLEEVFSLERDDFLTIRFVC